MTSLTQSQVDSRLKINATILWMLATWTIAIKFLVPLCYMTAEIQRTGTGGGPYILWDFWWVAHGVLAIWLWQKRPLAWELGMTVSVVEIIIIVTKFVSYFKNPLQSRFAHNPPPPVLDTFLTNNWFINKVFVLAFFIVLLVQLLRPDFKETLRSKTN